MIKLSWSDSLTEVHGKTGFNPIGKRDTDGSKKNMGTGAGVYAYGTGQNLCFSLGRHTQ
jgi:hypothetical protein